MASPSSHDGPSLTPLSMFYPGRTPSLSEKSYAPPTPSPLSPHPVSPPPPPSGPPMIVTTNSHYYRPPRSGSALTSPTRSNVSSPAHSPIRSSRQSRIQSLLATDPLLSRLTPVTINRLSSSGDFDFDPAEKEWSLRAVKGTVKVNEWLREVDGWNREWRRSFRESKDAGDGYLPPTDRPKKRRKTVMGSIQEEEVGDVPFGGPKPVRRKLFSEDAVGRDEGMVVGGDTPKVEVVEIVKSTTNSPSIRRPGKPLTPYQLKMQRQKAAAEAENIVPVNGTPQSNQAPTKTFEERDVKEEEEEGREVSDQEEDIEEDVEYWGSLKRSTIEGYEARIEIIKSEIEELDVDGLKGKVLSYRTGTANPLTDSSAIITVTTLQLLPPLSRLTKLLSVWAVRIAVLHVVPVFLRRLQVAKDALEAGYIAINHASISPSYDSSSVDQDWRGLEEESYVLMQETITQKVATAGRLMDTMLDALEGREDVLPEKWIAELEEVEEGVSCWEMDGERVVLEGRLRLEEIRMRQGRREEEAREREKTLLVLEQERNAQEARAEENAAADVMEKAEETDRQLREALETNDIVAGSIELPDDDENGWIEPEANKEDLAELFSRLEDVEKERLLSEELEERGRRARRAGSADIAPAPNGFDNRQDPPEPPITSDPLVVENEEDQNDFFPIGEASELPIAANGVSFVSRLFSSMSQTPIRKPIQAVEEASRPSLNVSATHLEGATPPQPSEQPQDEDERIRREISRQMERNLVRGQNTRTESRSPSAVEEPEKAEEEEGEEGSENKSEDALSDDEAIRLNIVQQMEKLMIGDSGRCEQVEIRVPPDVPAPRPVQVIEDLQPRPQTLNTVAATDDEIRQRITQQMERSIATTSSSPPEQQKEVAGESSQAAGVPELAVLEAVFQKQPETSTNDEEIRRKVTREMEQLISGRSVVRSEVKQENQPTSRPVAAEPVVDTTPSRQPQAPTRAPQNDEAIRLQIQQEMQRLLGAGGALSTSTAVVAVDEPLEEEKKSPFSTPPRSIRHPSPPIIGDDDQIRRKIVAEMEQFISQEHVSQPIASPGSTIRGVQQHILQPEPRSITASPNEAEDEQIRQQIVRQMEQMMIRDITPAVNEPLSQETASNTPIVVQHVPSVSQTVPEAQVHSSDDDERVRRKAVEEMGVLLRGESASQPATAQPTASTQETIARPAFVSAQLTPSGSPADDELIKRKITAEMKEWLKKEQAEVAEGTNLESDLQSGLQQAGPDAGAKKQANEKLGTEAERRQLAREQTECERTAMLAEDEEKAREAEAHKAAELEVQRLVEEEELAEKARLEEEAEKAAKAERLLVEEAGEKEKAIELERLAEAERQRLDARRHEEESAAAKALEERRAAEVERVAVMEAARQVFVKEQAEFDDRKFQELDRQRRLAEDERVRLADLALAERERAREARQMAESIQREREIEAERVRAENLRLGTTTSNTEERLWDIETETSSTAAMEDDSASEVFDTAAESEGSGDELDYSDIWKAQTGYETPRAVQEIINEDSLVGEVSRALEAASGASSLLSADDKDYVLLDEADIKPSVEESSSLMHVQEGVSETSSDMDSSGDGSSEKEDRGETEAALIFDNSEIEKPAISRGDAQAAEISELLPSEVLVQPTGSLGDLPGLFAPSPSMLVSPESSGLIENFGYFDDDEGFSLSRGYSFDTPSIILAPSTPQKGNTPQKGDSLDHDHDEDFMATPRGNNMSPQSPDDLEHDTSEFDIKPVATSTPKNNWRLTVPTGLDSITEILTPHSAKEYFKESDSPNYDSAGLGDTFLENAENMLPPELSEKVAKKEISRDPTRATSASKNRSVATRSITPTLGKGSLKDQKQRFTFRSSSPVPSTASAGYKRPTSSAEARPPSRGPDSRPSSRAQEFRTPSRAQESKTARPPSRAGASTPGRTADGSNSSTPTAAPLPAIRPMRRLRRDTVSTDGGESEDDDPRRFLRENTPEMNNSPDFAKAPRLQVSKRHARQPSNFTSTVTPEKSSRFHKGPYAAEGSSLVLPATPMLQVNLDDKINEILGNLPSKVRLTASNLQKLSESTKRLPPLKPFDLSSPTAIPGPKSTGSSPSIASEVPSYARASGRRHNSSTPGDIKLYHLHRSDGQAPIKLYIRLVGEMGERVMVRVGGGWADLAEYLKEYATHHGSKRRVVSEGRVEIQDLSSHSHHGRTLHPSRSISSFRSVSPGPAGSRPGSPLPGGNRPSTSFSMRRSESPMLTKRSSSPSLRTMRGGHNGTLSSTNATNKTSPTTPASESFLPPTATAQLTPPNRNSPSSRPGSRPGSSSSTGYARRPASRLSFTESAFDGDYSPLAVPHAPPKPLGLAGPRGKHVHPENAAWVEGVLGQVRKASADRRAQLLAAAGNFEAEEIAVESSPGENNDFGGRLGELGKVGGTRRMFPKKS